MKRIRPVLFIVCCFFCLAGFSQESKEEKVEIDGHVMTALITDGDTIIMADLEDVSVTSPRKFENMEEYHRYLRYRRYANQVYPYAVQAIRIFRELEEDTGEMSRRKRKKHVKKLQKELDEEFKEPLKKLTKTQGKILVKMIEKELDKPMYELLKNLKGSTTAFYWNQFGKIYGYRLKEGYIPGQDPIMDSVLQDYDISYDIKK